MTIKKITLSRAEGLTKECITVSVEPPTLEGADAVLRKWASTAPDLGYHKTDFFIEWNDDFTYSGCYLLQKKDQATASIFKHIQKHLEYYADVYNEYEANEILNALDGRF